MLIDDRMQTKIADFGLSVDIDSPRRFRLCGTTHFLPPEVVEEHGSETKSDIWAVGVTSHQLYFGKSYS